MNTATAARYMVKIEHDADAENPSRECGAWRVYSFNTRHVDFRHPDKIFKNADGSKAKRIAWKLNHGLAFVLSYYEHGAGKWSIRGTGPQCDWDTVQFAGIAVWEEPAGNMGAKTVEDRQADCERFLEDYSAWCNGECFRVDVEDSEGETLEGSTTVYGMEQLVEVARDMLPADAARENTEIESDLVTLDEVFDK